VLSRPDVSFGFSNPNHDPCGYRAVTVLCLASMYYGKPRVFNELVVEATNIHVEEVGGRWHVYVPANLEVKSKKLIVRDKEVDLVPLLEAKVLDYAFEYRSIAVQHQLRFVELPPEISLGDPSLLDLYAKVTVYIMCGTDQERGLEGGPIAYGVTIPNTAENRADAAEFIKLLLSNVGREVFEGLGQPFLERPVLIGEGPSWLRA